MSRKSKDLLRPSAGPSNFTNEFSRAADKAASFVKGDLPGKVPRGTTEDVLGNLGEMLGGGRSREAMEQAYLLQRRSGISPKEAKKLAQSAAEESLPARAQTYRDYGRKIGRGFQNIENFSRGVEKFGEGVAGGMLKGARAGSYVAGKGGSAVKNAAKIAQPLENRGYLRYGSEELYRPDIVPSEAWQERRKRDKLSTILAAE